MANRESNKRKRGRPVHKLSVMPFLLDPDNVVKKVTKEICSKEAIIQLMQNGYGPPQPGHCTNTEKGKVEFSFQLTNEQFKQKLYEIYPKLENGCFVFMKADKHNTLEELGAGSCCYRCYTPENVYHSNPGQGRLYIRRIAENEISSSCNHGISRFKRLCGMVGGSPQLYIPILPKPVLAVPPSNSVVVAESENVVTSAAMPTNSQLSASVNLRMELRPLLCNTPPQDLSSSSNVVAHTESTPLVQNSGNMVTQKSLPSSTSTSVNESRLQVSVSGNSTAQGPSAEPAIYSGTEIRPPFHIPGDMVIQSQLPLSAIVPQTASMPAVPNSGNMIRPGRLSLSTIVSQAVSNKPIQSSVNMISQSQLPLSTIVPETASTPAFPSSDNMVGQSQLQTFVSATATRQGQFSRSVGVSDGYLEHPIFSASSETTMTVGEILQALGIPPIADTNGNLVTIGNTNMLQAAEIGSQMTNEVTSGFRDPNMQVSYSNMTALPNPSVSDRCVQSTGLDTLADVIEIVQREQREEAITSMANSLNVQGNVDLPELEELSIIDTFFENVKSTRKLEISLVVLDNDALLKKLNECTINIHTVEIQSTCKVHQVLRNYSLPPCLEVLRINQNNLNFEDISALVGSLSSVNGLHELDLSRTKFKESSFFAFICVLNFCKDLKSLILTDNGLTKQQITGLITQFESMRNLKNLNLSKNNLTETQANDILQKHGQAKNIVSLDLSQNALQGNEIITGTCQLQSLEELNLSNNYIKCFPLPNLEGKRNNLSISTKIVSLPSNHMTPADICQFCSLIRSDLVKLDLDFNHVGNSIWSLCSLGSRIKHLKVLSLANTAICGAIEGLAILLSLVGELEELNLSFNNLMLIDFRQLQSPFSNLTQLKKLNLSMNAIGPDGITALANIFKTFPFLEWLDMSRSCIKEDEISALCKGLVPLSALKYLNLSGNRIDIRVLDDALFLPLTLEELIFGDILHGEKLFAEMIRLKNLRKLHLSKLKLRACDAEALAAMLSSLLLLEELSLADIVVQDLKCEKILNAMNSLSNIKRINLSGIKLLDENAFAYTLSSLLSLEELVLTDMNVASMGCERYISAIKLMKHLRKLNLGCVKVFDEKALSEMLSSLSILEEIVFPDVVLGDIDCMTGYFSALESLRYLKNLDLHCTRIFVPGVTEALTRVLPSLQLLEKLVLGRINFDDECQKKLFVALGKLKYLKELNLCETQITQPGAEALAEALPSLQLLEKLELQCIDCDGECQKQLFAALGKLKYLKEVNLWETHIAQSGAEALAEALPSLQLLEKLELQCIDCDGECQKQLFAALGKLKYLKTLDLRMTGITQASAEALAETLPSLQLLKHLFVRSVDQTGATALKSVLPTLSYSETSSYVAWNRK